ncbi:MAG: DUF5615 family PIN-like protein [Calothrix sp. MO_167.B12]|nr:DUF5615 family PIN-like protein [Calothrix sp. MO_167.B12]
MTGIQTPSQKHSASKDRAPDLNISVNGMPDSIVLEVARSQQRVLLTRNCDDFLVLHEANPNHPGILAIYQDADPTKAMNYIAIMKAISNLEETGLSVKGEFIVINQYNW